MTTLSRKLEVVPLNRGTKKSTIDDSVAAILNFRGIKEQYRPEGWSLLRNAAERYFHSQRHHFSTKEMESL